MGDDGAPSRAATAQHLHPVRIDRADRLRRALWHLAWATLYRWSPTPLHGWRRTVLRAFGARIAAGAHPYPRVRIWAPWNLRMDAHSCLANDVDCYCVAPVILGAHATVSQYSHLCTATHDFRDAAHPLVAASIVLQPGAWIAADVFVGPGVRIGRGAVVGARSSVFGDVPELSVVAGSPPTPRGTRPALAPWCGLPLVDDAGP